MRSHVATGLMMMTVATFMITACAEAPKQAAPPSAPPPAPPPAPMASQEKPADDMELIREKVRADKKLLVAMNMEMTEAEAEQFWPVYDRYQEGLGRIIDRELELINTFAKNYETMSDGVAKQLLEDYLQLQDDLFALKQSYLPKFRAVLPDRKVARYYQIENKIEAVLDLDLAANIPLVQ